MTHEDALNQLLSFSCPQLDNEESKKLGYQEYFIELHCYSFVIQAKMLGNCKYEIFSCKRVLKE